MFKTIRTMIGVGVVGPLAGIGRYMANPAGFVCGALAFSWAKLTGSESIESQSLFALGAHTFGSIVKLTVHSYESYMTLVKLVQLKSGEYPLTNSNRKYLNESIDFTLAGNPIGNSILYGYDKANQVAGHEYYGSESYKKAHEINDTAKVSRQLERVNWRRL